MAGPGPEAPPHRVFLNSPVDLAAALHCRVRLASRRGAQLEGSLLAADPVSDTAVLLRGAGPLAAREVSIVPGVDWASLAVLDRDPAARAEVAGLVAAQGPAALTPEEAAAARGRVAAWLRGRGLPVAEEGELLVVAGAVTLEPPYTADSALTDNEIVLARVAALLAEMPVEPAML